MDSPFIVFNSDYEGRQPKLGQKRCNIGLSILLKEGAKLRTTITFQTDAKFVNKFPSKKMRNFPTKGAKSDSSLHQVVPLYLTNQLWRGQRQLG